MNESPVLYAQKSGNQLFSVNLARLAHWFAQKTKNRRIRMDNVLNGDSGQTTAIGLGGDVLIPLKTYSYM